MTLTADLEHDEGGELPGERAGVDVIFLSHIGKPSHINLPELEVGEAVIA